MNSKLIKTVIEDTFTRHKSTGEPVNNIVKEFTAKFRLGSRDRNLVNETIFNIFREKPWPNWFLELMKSQYNSEFHDLELSFRKRAKPVLAVDLRFSSLISTIEELKHQEIECAFSKFSKNALILSNHKVDLSKLEHCWWMNDGSQYVALQIKSDATQFVLDLCAGKGGKTRIIMETGAKITAIDINKNRLTLSKGVKCINADGRFFKSKQLFDWILVDAPCSGTGTIRHAPDLFGRLKLADIQKFAKLQTDLILNAAKLLKPSGILVYATCSVLKQENHEYIEGLKLISNKQLLPNRDDTDGFYIANFCKETN